MATFDGAWEHFLAGEEPLESFHDRLDEDNGATIDVWLFQPAEEIRRAAAGVQQAFAPLDWIDPTPFHFLHVTLKEPLPDTAFEATFRGVNCFHEAVVVEVEAPALPGLPHLTVGYVRASRPADELRKAPLPLRGLELGAQTVEEVLLCRVPAARTTFLRPWRVVEAVPLRR